MAVRKVARLNKKRCVSIPYSNARNVQSSLFPSIIKQEMFHSQTSKNSLLLVNTSKIHLLCMSISEKLRWSAHFEAKGCSLMLPITLRFSLRPNGVMLLPFLFRVAKISFKIGSTVIQLKSLSAQGAFC